MVVRDATPADLSALADLVGTSENAARGMWRDRTVRVFVGADEEVTGCVAFDATESAVSITRLAGEPACFDALLGEVLTFASGTDLPVEMVVPEGDERVREALFAAGFVAADRGPRFDGEPTTRFRLECVGDV